MANTLTGVNLPTYQISNAAGTGGGGQFLTTGGINGTTWTNTSGYQLNPSVVVTNDPASLEVKGKIIHNGRDLEERLTTIEKVLMIPERDVIMEKKYPKLKKLYDEYIKELSKCQMWEELKGNNEN